MKTTANNGLLEKMFKLRENGTNVKTEIIAGFTTFIAMAYIIFVNPGMMADAGMEPGAAFVATCLAAAIGTLLMGFMANLPFALAPGMGLNAFFTYTIVFRMGYTWEQALAAVFISGCLFIILTLTGLRQGIVNAIPESLKHAIGGGIGLFIALIGFKSAGIVISDKATLVAFGDFTEPKVIVSLIGIAIIAILMARKVKGAILLGILATTIISIPMGVAFMPENFAFRTLVSMPPSIRPTFLQLDFKGLLNLGEVGFIGALTALGTVVLSLSLVDMFDTIGTLIGTASKAGMLKDGKLKNMNQAMLSDAIATSAGALLGTSTTTTFVESAAGIGEGGKTGLTAVTTGLLFIGALFFSTVVGIVPAQATAPALIVVGVLMMSAVSHIDFNDFTEALPAFFTIAIMPFTFSIANGIGAGVIFYPIVKLVTGKHKEIHPGLYVIAFLFIIKFIFFAH
jgi:adenine/guanine/hypoxanthine permease